MRSKETKKEKKEKKKKRKKEKKEKKKRKKRHAIRVGVFFPFFFTCRQRNIARSPRDAFGCLAVANESRGWSEDTARGMHSYATRAQAGPKDASRGCNVVKINLALHLAK